jgi:hypothetical protein
MPGMHQPHTAWAHGTAPWGPVPADVPAVLQRPSAEHASPARPRRRDAGRHRPLPGESWPGESVGVRAPLPGETPLSWPEILTGLREGVLP